MDDPHGWAQQRAETAWAQTVAPREGPSIQEWASPQELIKALDAAGLDRAVAVGWYWENPETCALHARWLGQIAQESAGRILALAPFHPGGGTHPLNKEKAFDAARRAIEVEGCVGFGEIHPWAQGFSLTDPTWERLCGWASESRLPVLLHVTEGAGHAYTGRVPGDLQALADWAMRFPDLPIILAHWGGGLPFFLLNPKLRTKLRHLTFDTAASPRLYSSEVWATVLSLAGAERILFGSDFPLRLYSGKTAAESLLCLMEEARGNLPEEAFQQALRTNPAKLFGG